jgi:hypothetical protein
VSNEAFSAELRLQPVEATLTVEGAIAICSLPLQPGADAEVCGKFDSGLAERGEKPAAMALLPNPSGPGQKPFVVAMTFISFDQAGDMSEERLTEFMNGVRKGAGAHGKVLFPSPNVPYELVHIGKHPALHSVIEVGTLGQGVDVHMFFRKSSVVTVEVTGPIVQLAKVKDLSTSLVKTLEMPVDISPDFGKSQSYLLGKKVGQLAVFLVPVAMASIGGTVLLIVMFLRRAKPAPFPNPYQVPPPPNQRR